MTFDGLNSTFNLILIQTTTATVVNLRESEISRFHFDAKILEIGEGTNET